MSRHQKRVTVPRSWPIARKNHKWVAKASPGPHSSEDSMPMVMVVRDMLKLTDNSREVKRILYEGKVLVDGKVVKDHKLPVGIFDIISIPALNQDYRMLRDERGMFFFKSIESTDRKKLVRVENKTTLKGNKQQLNFNDGSNRLEEGTYKTGDSLILSIPEKKIEDRIEFKEGNLAIVVGGKHSGQTGRIKTIHAVRSSRPNRVVISGVEDFETIADYVFMIGRDEPAIALGAVR
jgi:small subunit ribosomal protein S4e